MSANNVLFFIISRPMSAFDTSFDAHLYGYCNTCLVQGGFTKSAGEKSGGTRFDVRRAECTTELINCAKMQLYSNSFDFNDLPAN